MHKIALITLLSIPLFAGFFPQTVETSIKSIKGNSIILKKRFPISAMSGIVLHDYGNGLNAITSYISKKSLNRNRWSIDKNIIYHNKIPTVKRVVVSGDRVIAGYLYNNVLVLAPDEKSYQKVISKYNKNWTHPDLFALYLSINGEQRATKENLSKFAKKFHIGLIYIIKRGSSVLFDPISGFVVSKKSNSNLPKKGHFPFHMRFDKIESGWFTREVKGNYYKDMERF